MLGSSLVPTMVLCSVSLAWPPSPPELAAHGSAHWWFFPPAALWSPSQERHWQVCGYIRKGMPTADSCLGPLPPSFPSFWSAEVLRAPDHPTVLLREPAPGIPVPFSPQPMHSKLPGTLARWLFNQQGHKFHNTEPAPLSPRCPIFGLPLMDAHHCGLPL
jgi:hypothetical protein